MDKLQFSLLIASRDVRTKKNEATETLKHFEDKKQLKYQLNELHLTFESKALFLIRTS